MKINIKLEKRIPNFNNEELIKIAKETNDSELRDKIIKNNMHFAIKLVNRTISNGSTEDPDDLVGIAMIGLVKAYDTYDCSREIKFSTYMAKVITREFSALARAKGMKCRSKYSCVSMDDNMYKNGNEESEKTVMDFLADNSHSELIAVEDVMFNEVLEDNIESMLTDNEKIFSRKYFFEGMSVADIGRDMNVTRQRAHQHFKNSIRKLAPVFS
ncbi:sigma-70 family RNA polymerase sigma factor [Paenibacillus illinoisensis]|uniref:RNA polymerase sigma factor n=1 Tax=Paenibacillus illinoisensis TaxID=59845 RepID=A0A2W0CWY7_9BACL|nr:sigma-70 family RNA polymerase sigma factor [Paenibacillus illinoisensis]PYY28171.1 RNA polymerase sigma factor [Paenibacillus illinoisensis]